VLKLAETVVTSLYFFDFMTKFT